MGLFSKLKNFVTGGGVNLTLQIVNECYLRKPFDVELTLAVDDLEIEAELIYIEVKFVETVRVRVNTSNSQGHSTTRTVTKESILYEDKIYIERDFVLEPNREYNYTTTIQLPLEASPSFEGVHSKLVWSLQAFIQKSGNDPESEVLIFDPLYELV